MQDYQPSDLSTLCNVGPEVIDENANPAIGTQTFHGLPFQIGLSGDNQGKCFLGFGKGVNTDSIVVPLKATPIRIIVAHRLLESKIFEGDPVGRLVAHYIFRYANGEENCVPIRERFEIAVVPPGWGQFPFLAWPDQKDGLQPRNRGHWGEAGYRQTEATQAWPNDYYLWVWENPKPSETIESVQIVPEGPKFILAAITLGHLDEDVIPRTATREVKITLPQTEDSEKPFRMEVGVDRGVATYPYPLPEKPADHFSVTTSKGGAKHKITRAAPRMLKCRQPHQQRLQSLITVKP